MSAVMAAPQIAMAHDRRCTCDVCKEEVKRQFKAYDMIPWRTRFLNTSRTCPQCKRETYGRGRGGFIVWSCWSCNMHEAKIVKVVNGAEDNQFGFAERIGDGKPVYFHLSKRCDIVVQDGRKLPELLEVTETQIPVLNTEILYHELTSGKGLKALWWAYKADYTNAIETIKNRKTYRFMWRQGRVKLSRLDGAEPVYHQMWRGDNLTELQVRHGQISIYGNKFDDAARYFEELVIETDDFGDEIETWVPCDDPRLPKEGQ